MQLVIAWQTHSVLHPKEHLELQSSVDQMEAITVSSIYRPNNIPNCDYKVVCILFQFFHTIWLWSDLKWKLTSLPFWRVECVFSLLFFNGQFVFLKLEIVFQTSILGAKVRACGPKTVALNALRLLFTSYTALAFLSCEVL